MIFAYKGTEHRIVFSHLREEVANPGGPRPMITKRYTAVSIKTGKRQSEDEVTVAAATIADERQPNKPLDGGYKRFEKWMNLELKEMRDRVADQGAEDDAGYLNALLAINSLAINSHVKVLHKGELSNEVGRKAALKAALGSCEKEFRVAVWTAYHMRPGGILARRKPDVTSVGASAM